MSGRFAFLIHPLDMRDVIRFEPKAATKRLPLVEKILDWMPPFVGSDIVGIQSAQGWGTSGWFITVPMLPQMFVNGAREKVLQKIIAAGKLGAKKGARIVGLGAYTSVVGDAGVTVANNLDIAVTTG
ncbi:MAG TPA: shikimate dehydrogenase, partial [Candidatus Xenobia bacterium]